MSRFTTCLTCVISILLAWGTTASGVDRWATAGSVSSVQNQINACNPGDRVIIPAGTYNGRVWVSGKHGTANNMIQVVAADPDNRPVFTSNDAACFTLFDCSYIEVDGLIAYGGGTASSPSNNIEFALSNHMILKNSYSYEIDHNGNSDATKFAQTSNILMYRSTIENWADGGSGCDQMVANRSLLMRNHFAYPTLPTYAGANGTQPKGDSYYNGYYKNTFLDGSARSIQFGGSSAVEGWEGYDMVAMGNVIDAGEASVAYVSSRDCVFDYNTIVNPEIYVMRILNEGGWAETGYNTFRRNLVQYGNLPWGVQNNGSGTQPETFDYTDNYWYKSTNPAGSIPSLPGTQTGGQVGGTNPQLDADYRPLYAGAEAYGAHAPDMEAAWQAYVDLGWFDWAWAKALLEEPDADAGQPEYRAAPGFGITLDASGSYLGRISYGMTRTASYTWDLDGDRVCDDASGETVALSYADLTGALALTAPGLYTIEVRMATTDEYGTIVDWDTATLRIIDQLIPGDADLSGEVDLSDLSVLAFHWEDTGAGWLDGDFDDDGDVDLADLSAMAYHWGDSVWSAPPVPEPGTIALLAAGATLLVRRWRA